MDVSEWIVSCRLTSTSELSGDYSQELHRVLFVVLDLLGVTQRIRLGPLKFMRGSTR